MNCTELTCRKGRVQEIGWFAKAIVIVIDCHLLANHVSLAPWAELYVRRRREGAAKPVAARPDGQFGQNARSDDEGQEGQATVYI